MDEELLGIQKRFKNKTLRAYGVINSLISSVRRGDNRASEHRTVETLIVEDEWLSNIENGIKHIENIILNPKTALKEERSIVNTSKAKRTDSETIRYLSSHTGDIESIVGDEIRPSKLNVREIDTDTAIYENRFVYATLVWVRSFLQARYNGIKTELKSRESRELKVKSSFQSVGGMVEYDLCVRLISSNKDSQRVEENQRVLERIESLRTRVSSMLASNFSREMAKTKQITPPISKTNILRGHTDYKACYNLWLYLSSYTALGYSISIDEQSLPIAGEYSDDISCIIAMSVKNMVDNNKSYKDFTEAVEGEGRGKTRKFKPIKSVAYKFSNSPLNQASDETLINQLYYEKIKSILSKKNSDKVFSRLKSLNSEAEMEKAVEEKTEEDGEVRISTAFRAYYKSVAQINNLLFEDALELKSLIKSLRGGSLEERKGQIENLEEGIRRITLLKKLKEADLKTLERDEERIRISLQKQKCALKAKQKAIPKIKTKKAKKENKEKKVSKENKASKEIKASKENKAKKENKTKKEKIENKENKTNRKKKTKA